MYIDPVYQAPVLAPQQHPLARTEDTPNNVEPIPGSPPPKLWAQKPRARSSSPLTLQNTLPFPPWVIKDSGRALKFLRVALVGEGASARVYEVKDPSDSRLACKVVTKDSFKTKKAKTMLYAGNKIHRTMEHPNVVHFKECFEDEANVYMTLELCHNGSLMDLLRHRRRFTEPEARFFMVQLLGACYYMHTHQVIHRDLKLGNIFLDGNMNVKVGDFGIAALIESPGERKKTIWGTPNYIAPEVLFDTEKGHSFEADIWSIGVVLYTLVIGSPPFQTKDVKGIYKHIRDNVYDFPENRRVSLDLKELVQKILVRDPEARPTLLGILDHPFFIDGTVPAYIPISARDRSPDFSYITRKVSQANLARLRRLALLDEYQVAIVSVPAIEPGSADNICGVRTLLNLGADIYGQETLMATPLHIACGANANDRDFLSARSSLRSMPDYADAVIMLAAPGANVCAVDVDGATPLHLLAARIQRVGATEELYLTAIFAALARAAPGALDILDVRRRTPRACIARDIVPRLDNLLWRLSTPGVAFSLPTDPRQFYDNWLGHHHPEAALLQEKTPAGYDKANNSLPANKLAKLKRLDDRRRRQTIDSGDMSRFAHSFARSSSNSDLGGGCVDQCVSSGAYSTALACM